ncbi:hypothetical protein QA639_21795 [Bradyrhizobium pachyrhizi]|uniref:hypothetical protein n=1 Tax=Bradyrhizobium pachyrhizi TaxID=280333 RepID=UPI0024B25C82|nr:hypothetical protein [Bradyrhizobium pachyrhizi]WFU52343.1 hypothetical protein QA639_21795 [Bradyrhizobium pachyrhizi]
MTNIRVYDIPVPKDKLRAMPIDERGFLLSLGYSANYVSMLQKLLIFSMNSRPPSDAETLLSAAQTQMLLRLLIGALHETWVLINDRYLDESLERDYGSRLDDGGRAALSALKTVFQEPSVLTIVRNNFSFHYPNDKVLNNAIEDAYKNPDSDDLWRLYFSQYGFNSLFLVSDLMAIHGISRLIKESDVAKVQERLMSDVRSAADATFQFTNAFFAAAWQKNFGSVIDAKALITIDNPPLMKSVTIPFFVDMNG